MPTYQVIVLAVIQGLTEFLPISSTAHLALIPRLLHWRDPGLGFDIALHFGTLIAVVVYFFPTWSNLLRAALRRNVSIWTDARSDLPPQEEVRERRLLSYLAIATVPAMIAGLIFHRAAEGALRTPMVIGIAMIAVGVYMWWSETACRPEKALLEISMGDALGVGMAQALAIVPGVSRSGSTIATGLLRNMKREVAARFSFLLSTPIIAGAALVEVRELLRAGLQPEMRFPFVLGMLVSGAVGYAAIWGLIRYVRTRSLMIFVVYRIAAGVLIIVMATTGTI